jgi:autoinducer 2 (AI-2) kinase
MDEAGDEIYAGPNLDLRAVFEGGAIDDEMRERVYRTTGRLPSMLFSPAKLRWFKLHRPEAYGRISRVLTLADWVVWRLTGAMASEVSLACEAGLVDIHTRGWCTALMEDMGLMADTVPLTRASAVVGTIKGDASSETGLVTGTPVIASGADTQCGLLGMGVAQEHQVGIVAGWSAPLQMVTLEPVLSPEASTWAGCFLEDGKWVLESSTGDAGNSYRWLADTFCGGGKDVFMRMDELAGAVAAGSDGAFALLGPARMDAGRPGMRRGGILFPVPLTFSDLGLGHVIRASLEAIAFAIKANLEQMEELAGAQATDVAIGGGMTRTGTFVRLLADVLGRQIKVSPFPDVSARGAELCARTALGEFGSLEEASMSVRPRLRMIDPDPLDSAEYQDRYEEWVGLQDQLHGVNL